MLSRRFENISESKTVSLTGLIAQLLREGRDIVALGAGEPDFDTPDFVKQAGIDAIRSGFTKYTAADGVLDLREAVCRWLDEEYQGKYSPQEIIITSGAKYAVYQALAAVCDPGDEVILPVPYWVSYPEQIKLVGATIRTIDTFQDNGLKITPEALQSALGSKTKCVILNSPNNPSGVVYTKEEVDALVEVLRNHSAYIVSDEIYDKIIYDGEKMTSLASYPDLKDRLLLINGVSKSFSMTGWRIGFLAGPAEVVKAVKRFQGHTTSNPCSISQKAAIAAYAGEQSFLQSMLHAFTERRNYVYKRLGEIPHISCVRPQGAFYAFPDVSSYYGKKGKDGPVKNSMDLCNTLLRHFNVGIVPGSAFGMDKHVRLSFATSMENLVKALDRINEGLLSLK